MSSVASLSATGSIAGGISISGLGNGTDFSNMIAELKKIEMIPTQRLLKWKADWRARQEAFKQVREQLVNLRSVASKMNSMDTFMAKSGFSSDGTVATATATSNAIDNSYKLEVLQTASTSIWSLGNEFSSTSANINTSGASQVFSYEYAGTVRTISVQENCTLENLKNMINNDAGNPGVRASLIKGANGYSFQLKGMDQGTENTLHVLNSSGLTGFPSTYDTHTVMYDTELTNPSASITDSAYNFIFSYNGAKHTVALNAGDSLSDLAAAINAAEPGVNATIATASDGRLQLVMEGSSGGAAISAPKQPPLTGFTTPLQSVVAADPAGWHIQHSQNALIRVDGWPVNAPLEVSSNTVDGVVEGVTFTLYDVGTTNVSVGTDTETIKNNVMQFIDAVNAFRTTINELTKYDTNKATVDLEYANSLYEMQKGSILTGNYGVQLLSSQVKTATSGSSLGFLQRTLVDEIWMGDIYTSLSQIGIKTNAMGEGGANFGLLELNIDPALPTLDDALKENPLAVAELFAATNKGVSDSMNFSFVSSMLNFTQPGTYQVSYDIDGSGNVTNAYINGKEAKFYPETGQLGLLRQPPESSQSSAVTAETDGTLDFNAQVEVSQTAHKASMTIGTAITNPSDPAQVFVTTSGPFSYEYNGQLHTIQLDASENNSLQHVASQITYDVNNPGVVASVVKQTDGTYALKLEAKESGYGSRTDGLANGFSNLTTPTATTSVTTEDGQNAKYSINGGAEQQSATNTVTNGNYPGVTFTLRGTTTPGTPAEITGTKNNNADGLYIQIDNMAAGSHSGQVRIKQGKINELLTLLNGTSQRPEEGMLGSKGALQVLMDNYDKIIEGIDSKIQRESVRITKWERLQKQRFARLDAILKQYDSLSASIESQIKQLPGGNSSS